MLKLTSLRKFVQKTSRVPSRMVQRKNELPDRVSALHPLLRLQQIVGNQAVSRLIQAKLKVGQPGDRYEQEADRIANAVMRMPEPRFSTGVAVSERSQGVHIQRVCPECGDELRRQPIEEEEEEVRRQPMEEEEEEETLQTQEIPGCTPKVTPDVQAHINAMRGGGQPLPESVRAFFEPRFGYDFSQVRMHTGVQAAERARAVKANAFTVGRNIVFGAGQFTPGTTAGRRLLAHELTHVVQQKGNRNNPHLVSLRQFREPFVQNHVAIQMTVRKALQFKRKDEEAVFDLVNKKRGENLKWSDKLYASARKHSKWMYRSKKLVHTRRLIIRGYDLAGENIGRGYAKNADVVDDWSKSPLHYANITRREFEEAAVGVAGKGAGRYFTQHFGAVDPRATFWLESSKQKGENWTHIIRGKVSDNIDSADKLLISIAKVKGDFDNLPKQVTPDRSGSVTIAIVTVGMGPAAVRITTTDSHGNSSKEEVSLG